MNRTVYLKPLFQLVKKKKYCVVDEQLTVQAAVDVAMCAVYGRSSHCLSQLSQPDRDLLIKFRG